MQPEIIFADQQPVTITIDGKNFFNGMQLIAVMDEQTGTKGYCNLTSSEVANCYGLAFSKSGSYSLGFLLDTDNKVVGGANIRISVDKPLIIEELLNTSGEKTHAHKAILRVRGISELLLKHNSLPILCEAYDDAA